MNNTNPKSMRKPAPPAEVTFLGVSIPTKLKLAFRAHCGALGLSMGARLRQLVETEIKCGIPDAPASASADYGIERRPYRPQPRAGVAGIAGLFALLCCLVGLTGCVGGYSQPLPYQPLGFLQAPNPNNPNNRAIRLPYRPPANGYQEPAVRLPVVTGRTGYGEVIRLN